MPSILIAISLLVLVVTSGCGTTGTTGESSVGNKTAIRSFYAETSVEVRPNVPRAIAGFVDAQLPDVAVGSFKSTDRIKICAAKTLPQYADISVRSEDGRSVFRNRWTSENPTKPYFDTASHIDPRGDPPDTVWYVTLDPLPPGHYRATLSIGNGVVRTIRFEVAY